MLIQLDSLMHFCFILFGGFLATFYMWIMAFQIFSRRSARTYALVTDFYTHIETQFTFTAVSPLPSKCCGFVHIMALYFPIDLPMVSYKPRTDGLSVQRMVGRRWERVVFFNPPFPTIQGKFVYMKNSSPHPAVNCPNNFVKAYVAQIQFRKKRERKRAA